MELLQRGADIAGTLAALAPTLDEEDVDDLDDAPDGEVERVEEEVLDRATASRTITELRTEIAALERLEAMAHQLRRAGEDRKWRELADLVNTEVFVTGAVNAQSDGESGEHERARSW